MQVAVEVADPEELDCDPLATPPGVDVVSPVESEVDPLGVCESNPEDVLVVGHPPSMSAPITSKHVR